MLIPVKNLVIPNPQGTSNNLIEPEYMAPIYQEIWGARLAATASKVEIIDMPYTEAKTIPSVSSEKAYLREKFKYGPAGQLVFDTVYPGDAFERAVDKILVKEARRSRDAAIPVPLPPALPEFTALGMNGDQARLAVTAGYGDIISLASATVSSLCETGVFSPLQADTFISDAAKVASQEAAEKAAREEAEAVASMAAKVAEVGKAVKGK
jgi:hypothetical protein